MTESHAPTRTADLSSAPADALDAGLAAGFGRPADGPSSVLAGLRSSLGPLQPVLLREAEGDSAVARHGTFCTDRRTRTGLLGSRLCRDHVSTGVEVSAS